MGQQVAQQRGAEVAHANAFHQTAAHQFFHGAPGLRQRDPDGLHGGCRGLGIVEPFGWIAQFKRHEGQGDREMDVVEIEHVQPKIPQRALAGRANMLRFMVGIPKLRGHPELLAAAQAVGQGRG